MLDSVVGGKGLFLTPAHEEPGPEAGAEGRAVLHVWLDGSEGLHLGRDDGLRDVSEAARRLEDKTLPIELVCESFVSHPRENDALELVRLEHHPCCGCGAECV